jgi:osmotically-inducible protein OsmY
MQDQAITAADQAVLAQVRKVVVPNGNGPWWPVNFSVANGVVTLIGKVPSAATQQQLEALVQNTPGVVAVVDQLSITSPTGTIGSRGTPGSVAGPIKPETSVVTGAPMNPADQTLLLRVRQSVVPQIQVASQPVPVNFTVQQGVVTINGAVTSLAQKRQIAALVRQVPGVVQVSDQMLVNSMGTVPNLSPTGRTNGVALPPMPQGRTDLPPGLQREVAVPSASTGVPNTSGTVQ